RRLLFEAGDDIDALMILCRADITSKNMEKVTRFLKNFDLVEQRIKEVEAKDHIRNFQPPVSGEDIMKALSIGPGKIVGIIKDRIKDAILEGEIHNNREEAWQLMVKIAGEQGIEIKSIKPDEV
ncbi:MAG: tRNA nucleotidyltransferase, partial [Cyclobacteriaceae bacterium]